MPQKETARFLSLTYRYGISVCHVGWSSRPPLAPPGIATGSGERGTKNERIDEMKLIMAVIKPFKLEDVRAARTPLVIEGMNITEVKGLGRVKA